MAIPPAIRRRRFLSQIASLGLAACGPAGRTGPAGHSTRNTDMRARVLYVDPAGSHDLAALAHEELGQVDGGAWVACPDETVRALSERRPPLFLYFDRRDCEIALAGLLKAEAQEAIRRRRERWTPQARAYVMAWLLDLERVVLEGALLAGASEAAIKSQSLLGRLSGLDRYETASAQAMVVAALEGESLLLATVQSALISRLFDAAPEDRSLLEVHRDRRRDSAKALAQAAGTLGAKEFANALPFANPQRAVFVHPAGEEFERALSRNGETAVRWRDGVVCVAAERRLESLRAQNRAVEILYADESEFYTAADSFTIAQLYRDFSARIGRSPEEVRRDFLGRVDRLHLHQILMKREIGGRSEALQAFRSAGLDDVLRGDVELLARSLARTQSFSRARGLDPAAARHAASTDLSLLSTIAARHWPSVAASLKQVEALEPSR